MDIRDVARLTMKVFGLYLAFRGLEGVLLLLEGTGLHWSTAASAGVLTFGLFIVFGILVWLLAQPLADRALRSSDGERGPVGRATPLDVHGVAFSVLGLYLVAQGLVETFGAVTILFESHPGIAGGGVLTPMAHRDLVAAAAYLVFGGVLIFGSRAIASRVRRIWREGRGMLSAHTIEITDPDESTRARITSDQLEFFDAEGNVVHRVP